MSYFKILGTVILFIGVVLLLYGCWYVAAAGAGAYGGYKAKEEGYTIQSPIKKESQPKKEEGKKKGETKNLPSEK
ncbi:MAG: hypothetical protein N2572_07385 [Syntrophales bacterium]|nr:hypothetical protein [Syntrophales bacterium]